MKLPFGKKNKTEKNQTGQQGQGNAQNQGSKSNIAAQDLAQGMVNIKDVIAPSALEVDFNHVKIGNKYYRTLFVSMYPRFVGANWLSPIINFEHTLDISMFYYPVRSKGVLDDLRRKITEMEATVRSNEESGKISDPGVKIALEDAKNLQEQLVKGVEKFFQFSFYITIPAESLEELNNITSKLESTLGSLLLISKSSTLQMEEAFQSTIPTAVDKLLITRNMDTTSLATTFPFTSSDLTSDDGIMYGINKHNGSLVIFDRFSLENANTVVFAKSGSGKSYFVKLEAIRSIVFGAEVIIIDPEEEYRPIAEAIGGDYISFSPNAQAKINPFDLSGIAVEGENELGQKLLSLHTLFKLVLGDLTPTEDAILDRALIETYRIKGITTDPETQRTKEPPVMEDLYKVLLGAEEKEARSMAERLEKYIKGSLAGIFDAQSTLQIQNKMTVFSTRNLEDTLRPVAFYIILDFIWTRIKRDLRKRILIVEEAWYLLQNEDSARFIYGIAKRARKYYLGLTTITQDVDDFLQSEYGRVIVTNSSIQVLLKQHPAAIDRVAETFYLSEGEKRFLLAANRGEGLFFAGANHVAIQVLASEKENALITTNPEELLKMKEQRAQRVVAETVPETKPEPKPAPVAPAVEPEVSETPKTTIDPLDPMETVEQKANAVDKSDVKISPEGNTYSPPPVVPVAEPVVKEPVVSQPETTTSAPEETQKVPESSSVPIPSTKPESESKQMPETAPETVKEENTTTQDIEEDVTTPETQTPPSPKPEEPVPAPAPSPVTETPPPTPNNEQITNQENLPTWAQYNDTFEQDIPEGQASDAPEQSEENNYSQVTVQDTNMDMNKSDENIPQPDQNPWAKYARSFEANSSEQPQEPKPETKKEAEPIPEPKPQNSQESNTKTDQNKEENQQQNTNEDSSEEWPNPWAKYQQQIKEEQKETTKENENNNNQNQNNTNQGSMNLDSQGKASSNL